MKTLLLLATIVLGSHCSKLQSRVIAGYDADLQNFPFVVSIKACATNVPCKFCTGSIIAKGLVLTAAHCVLDSNKRKLTTIKVKAGTTSRIQTAASPGQEIDVSDVKFPPTYNLLRVSNINRPNAYLSLGNEHDLAVLKLKTCLNLGQNNVNFVGLVSSNYAPRHKAVVTISGWGAIDPFNLKPATTLKYSHVKVISNAECVRFSHNGVTRNQICTFEKAAGLCQADAGAPLTTTEIVAGRNVTRLIGVYSHTTQWPSYDGQDHEFCGLNPDIYTSIAKLRTFIDSSFNFRGNTNTC